MVAQQNQTHGEGAQQRQRQATLYRLRLRGLRYRTLPQRPHRGQRALLLVQGLANTSLVRLELEQVGEHEKRLSAPVLQQGPQQGPKLLFVQAHLHPLHQCGTKRNPKWMMMDSQLFPKEVCGDQKEDVRELAAVLVRLAAQAWNQTNCW